MNTSLFCPLQTRISEAMLEAEGGWGKYPKTRCACTRKGNAHARKEIRAREYGRQQKDWCCKPSNASPIDIGKA